MKKLLKIGLIGFALGASAGVASATVGSEETVARPCCSSCDEGETYCMEACGYTTECINECQLQYRSCWRWCSFSC